jgi:hypothetical protein
MMICFIGGGVVMVVIGVLLIWWGRRDGWKQAEEDRGGRVGLGGVGLGMRDERTESRERLCGPA